jgi:glucose-1-phosphate thymidylyltransferase
VDALILGAGYATRLYPLTLNRPKPLLPIGGVPILERICDQIAEAPEVSRIHLVTNHAFAPQYRGWMNDYIRRRTAPPSLALLDDLTTSPENRLGAIGDLQFVIDQVPIADDLLVIAGDNLIGGGLTRFIQAAKASGPSVGLKEFPVKEKASLYGVVEIDPDHRVVGFEEKPVQPRSPWVAIGLYFLPRASIPLVRKYLDSGNRKDAPGYFLEWLYRQQPVYGHALDGEWYDIGDFDSYHKADEQMHRLSGSGSRL